MMTKQFIIRSKIGILIVILLTGPVACSHRENLSTARLTRFEKMLFTIPPAFLSDSIRTNHPAIIPFFRIFNEEIIHIGPDSLPDYLRQLEKFTTDTMILNVHARIEKQEASFQKACIQIDEAFDRWAALGNNRPANLITFLSGFNQSFVSLPAAFAIGLDSYLGEDCPYYQSLGIPLYIRKYMDPQFLTADAIKAWLFSELPGPNPDGGFLDRLIFEGRIYYIAQKLLPGTTLETLFHYSEAQLKWCQQQEKAMWKYLAEQKILFSTDRMTIRRFMDDAPFTRDFGNDSPGRAGTWIGYRIISSYMKTTGTSLKDLISKHQDSQEILSNSRYHP